MKIKTTYDPATPSFVDANLSFLDESENDKKIKIVKTFKVIEKNKKWTHKNIWGFDYYMKAKVLETELFWTEASKDKYYRFIKVTATDLSYSSEMFKKWDSVDSFWGNKEIFAIDDNKAYLKFPILEKIFKTKEEFELDIKNPSSADYTQFCNEIFADG